MNSSKRIVIVGGGFAGIKCAGTLRKRLPRNRYEIVLFNKENHMVFHPLLAEVVGASLNPEDVAASLRQMLPNVHCRTEDVRNIDLDGSALEYEGHDGTIRRLTYDHVVVACGGVVNLGMMPGMADHAFPMKTIGDAIALRAHVMQQLEKAEVCDDPEKKRWYLSFVVVGGGYSGVEVAGEINDLVRGSLRFFQNIKAEDISVTVIHGQSQLLPEIGSDLREFVRKQMVKAGINILLNTRVGVATPEGVGLADGSFISSATVVCTIGNSMSPVVQRIKSLKEQGRLVTEPDMRLPGYDNAWAIGDCASIINSFDGKPSPPTGQFAERQGRQTAENIVRALKNEKTRPFSFRPLGQLCSIGGHNAVAEMLGIHLSGFFAWFVWRGVYLMKLPSWSRRFKVGFNWAWQLIFSRDLVHLKTNLTERVCHAHYQAGDYVFRQGDPATNFYVVEKGEVEIVRESEDNREEILAVLGPGSFFGEMALLNNNPRNASVRARTTVEVVAMGRNVFKQVSNSLAPLRKLLTDAVGRRTKDIWQQLPAAREILKKAPLSLFAEPPPLPILRPESTFEEALRTFDRNDLEFCYVSKDCVVMEGVLTQSDLIQALEAGVCTKTPVSKLMSHDPIAVTINDSSLVAAATMRDHGLSWIPLVNDMESRHIEGYVKAQKMLSRVLNACSCNAGA